MHGKNLNYEEITTQIKERQAQIHSGNESLSNLFSLERLPLESVAKKNCENLIGSVVLPVGVAGPLPLESNNWQKEILIPLATTEGALVASVNRGCKAIRLSGGAVVLIDRPGVTRAPVFRCENGQKARELVAWMEREQELIKKTGEATSSHLKYISYSAWIRGRHVYVRFAFDTSEAMGMNMVSIATQKISELVVQLTGADLVSLSSNACADKKDSGLNQTMGRGFWAQAECVLSQEVIAQVLKTDSSKLISTHIQKNLVGSNVSQSFAQNGHVANVLAALYLATGQDPAHVVDGSRAFLTIEPEGDGLYCALTIPSVMVGTVGGGTYLPAQVEARKLIDPELKAEQLAIVAACAALAGEISLLAALATGTLAKAHQKLGRGQ